MYMYVYMYIYIHMYVYTHMYVMWLTSWFRVCISLCVAVTLPCAYSTYTLWYISYRMLVLDKIYTTVYMYYIYSIR